MTGILALKLFLVPGLIYAVTLAGRTWGPTVAGWLSAFPIVAGPILLAIALEQGRNFGAIAAGGTLLAVLAILVFNLAYAWASSAFNIFWSMSCAFAAYAFAVAALQPVALPVSSSFTVVALALLIALQSFPDAHVPPTPASRTTPLDLPWRMLSAAVLVLLVTFSARRLGPRLSGFLAMFPVMSTVLVGFSHRCLGRTFAVALLRGMTLGYFSFATFCLVVSLLLRQHTIVEAFSMSLSCAVLVQLGVKRLFA